MHIGYISYEHPLGITGGGIGTYLGQIARLMTQRGHEVEVFTGHLSLSGTTDYEGYRVHRVQAGNVGEFRERVAAVFAPVQLKNPFDIIESGEYGADAFLVKQEFPGIPLTLKLHTPNFLVTRLNGGAFRSNFQKAVFLLKCLRKGIVQKPFWIYDKQKDPEFALFQKADTLSSPSNSLKTIVGKEWGRRDEIEVLPLPFTPSDTLLAIPPAKRPTDKTVVCFIGKLEVRKGVVELMKAIPAIVHHSKNVLFRFIGEALPSPEHGLNMQEYIIRELKGFETYIEFTGKQPASRIPELLQDVHICVFPSRWENFPNVCLEAMSAGKLVIGTDNGGMADMITHGVNGLLVGPNDPRKMAALIIDVLTGAYDVDQIAIAARERIVAAYNSSIIGSITEELYYKTVRKAMLKGPVSLPVPA